MKTLQFNLKAFLTFLRVLFLHAAFDAHEDENKACDRIVLLY